MHKSTNLEESVMGMFGRPHVLFIALFGLVFCLAIVIHPTLSAFHAKNPRYDDPLSSILGDGRKLFANHFYTKADAYFHSGFYPTTFDKQESHQTAHMAEDAGVAEGKNTGDEEQFLGRRGQLDRWTWAKALPLRSHASGSRQPGCPQERGA